MISTRKAPMTFADFCDELLSHELLLNQQFAPSASIIFDLIAQKLGGGNPFGFHSGPRPFRPRYPERYPSQYNNGMTPMGMSSFPRNQHSSTCPARHSGLPPNGPFGPAYGSSGHAYGSSGHAYGPSGLGSLSHSPCQIRLLSTTQHLRISNGLLIVELIPTLQMNLKIWQSSSHSRVLIQKQWGMEMV
jgi:hypothetical protein